MTVYVDDMEADFTPTHTKAARRYVMCHMIADSEAELHAMAARIGVARQWYQRDHYDVTKSKRALAVQNGAREITMRQLGQMFLNRRRGLPLGTPEQAQAAIDAAWRAHGHEPPPARSQGDLFNA